jgi:hypothetical protein
MGFDDYLVHCARRPTRNSIKKFESGHLQKKISFYNCYIPPTRAVLEARFIAPIL